MSEVKPVEEKEGPPTIITVPQHEENADIIVTQQLGSDRQTLQKGRIDIRRFSNLQDLIDVTFHSWCRNVPYYCGGAWLRNISNDILNLLVSENGLGRKQYILALAGSKGVPVLRETDTRSWTERHITMRDEEKARQKGKIDVM